MYVGRGALQTGRRGHLWMMVTGTPVIIILTPMVVSICPYVRRIYANGKSSVHSEYKSECTNRSLRIKSDDVFKVCTLGALM
jgi:hypothetical protein